MSPIETAAMIMLFLTVVSMMAVAWAWTELRYDRKNRLEMETRLEAERQVLKDQIAAMAKQSFEIGSNWKKLSDSIAELTTKISAVQANQNTTSIGRNR